MYAIACKCMQVHAKCMPMRANVRICMQLHARKCTQMHADCMQMHAVYWILSHYDAHNCIALHFTAFYSFAVTITRAANPSPPHPEASQTVSWTRKSQSYKSKRNEHRENAVYPLGIGVPLVDPVQIPPGMQLRNNT